MTTTVAQKRPIVLGKLFEEALPGDRLASLDAVRGFTILVMIFVNDVAGVAAAPAWMKHVQPPSADGMTFVDIVFPAFLFIVGMSIPFAFQRRFERREPLGGIWLHVLIRTFSLLVIGVYMVNTESMSDGLLPRPVWTFLMYSAVILIWITPPRSMNVSQSVLTGLRLGGAALLILLAFLYRGEGEQGVVEMRTHWWGILGIIGWSYLAGCAAYLLLRSNVAGLLGASVLGYCVYVADSVGHFPAWAGSIVDLGGWGSHGALTISGVVLGVMLLPSSPLKTHADRARWAFLYSVGLAAAAYLLHAASDVHRVFIINKIYATIPWSLWCAAITIWVWLAFYLLLDVVRQRKWTGVLELSGQNALLAYILAPIFYSLFSLISLGMGVANPYRALAGGLGTGLARSILFAIIVVWLAAALRRKSFLLKL